MAEWVKREFTKGAIDKAGATLIPWWSSPGVPREGIISDADLATGYTIIQNWRSSHTFPLNTFQIILRARAKRTESTAIVAQRLKRFSSIMNKLVREPQMKLSQMQDLGGCRAIMSSVASVDRLLDQYQGGKLLVGLSIQTDGALKCYDYLRHPKEDGYRGVHVVGRYHARAANREHWNGHRIEIQLRSRLQHAFATAVETVTTFTKEPLKFGAGPTEWRRFFSLMGSALALREGTPLVPGTPAEKAALTSELRDSTKMLKVRQRLGGWARAMQTLPRRNIKDHQWLLLVLDTSTNTIKVTGYADRKAAAKAVAELEQQKRPEIDAVLVWVNSVKKLRAAYPNYYADTREFVDALSQAIR